MIMDSIVTAALVGTAQSQQPKIATGTPVDTLTAQLREDSIERALLLSAGARAIYRQAGQLPGIIPAVPAPAAPETLPTCSPRAASLLAKLLGGEFGELLPEALQRMQQVGLRLPYELLPAALDVKGAGERAAVVPVIGERGRWLSQINPAWAWVANYLPISDDPDDVETIWQEGAPGQREAVLRRLRACDPAQAREWLTASWKQEKAETRALFLKAFEVNLSNDDEPFLEKALDDRSTEVRAAASLLLASVPTSALSKRMQVRAAAMLFYERGAIHVRPFTELPREWLRDGIILKAPEGTNEIAFRFGQVLSLVPPLHWEERFGMTASDLLDANYSDSHWREHVIHAWTKAAILHHNETWLMPLWEWYYRQKPKSVHIGLMRCMPREVAEQAMMHVLDNADKTDPVTWVQPLSVLPRPWSEQLSAHFLQQLGQYMEIAQTWKQQNIAYTSLHNGLSIAMQSLSPGCFALALRWPDVAETTDDHDYRAPVYQIYREMVQTFKEGIRLRQQFIEEIA
jgi:hypothetical protein